MKVSERKRLAVRRALGTHGLRVVCLRCGAPGRWWPRERCEVQTPDGPVVARSTVRLRETPCPRCRAISLRSYYWVATHPDLARQASLRARSVAAAIE